MELLAQANYLGAFLVGLSGGVHCLGMCGGIVALLALKPARQPGKSDSQSVKRGGIKSPQISILLGYNLGRILSYMIAGAIAGGLGATVAALSGLQESRNILSIAAACFMIALGLYLAGIWQGIARLEKAGGYLWRYIEPASRRYIPARSFSRAVPLGLIWGWLPCGIVYTILIWSLSAGSALNGAFLMLAFGLGTLPNLLAMGLVASKLNRWARNRIFRILAGLLVAGLGLLMLLRAFGWIDV